MGRDPRVGLLRTVVLDKLAEGGLEVGREQFARAADAYMGLEWLLRRNPFQGKVFNSPKRMHVQEGLAVDPPIPEVWIVFSFDRKTVTIHKLRFLEPSKDDESVAPLG